MKRTEVIKTFMMIANLKKNIWSPWFIQKYFSVVRVKASSAKMIRSLNVGLMLGGRHRFTKVQRTQTHSVYHAISFIL